MALLADVNQVVSSDELIERVWGPDAPFRARATLRTYLSRLRGVIAPSEDVEIGWRTGGYVLAAGELSIDLHRFRLLLEQARNAESDDAASGLYGQALGLWRGDAFAGLNTLWLNALRDRVQAERVAAELDYADVRLRRGQHGTIVAELDSRAASRPLDERVAGQLMLALYRCGRPGDALARYARFRSRLADELGVDPSPVLRELHMRILTRDPAAEIARTDRPGIRMMAGPQPRPRELPPDVAGFIGRAGALSELDRLLDSRIRHPAATAICTVTGTAGVGKTALAVHWAHGVAAQFADGQLYVNLRGYDPGEPVDPTDVLFAFLRSLGLTNQELPRHHDELVARYRTLLADRTMLVLLDNAHSAIQVRDLLPGSGRSMTLITSRDHLAGLAVHHGIHHIELDLLRTDEAQALLRTHLDDRVTAEPDAATTLIKQCANLPLALRIAVQQAVSRTSSTLADLVAELADEHDRLDRLDLGDSHTGVRTVFSWSYRHLSNSAATLLRMLGMHPGRTIGLHAVAAVAATDLHRARQLTTILTRAHLITEISRERYGMHDLLHTYVAELAAIHDSDTDLRLARSRLFGYYLHAARHAANLYTPYRHRGQQPDHTDTTVEVPFNDSRSALTWLDTERENLLAIALHAAQHGWPAYTRHLSDILFSYLDTGNYYADAERLHTAAHHTQGGNDTTSTTSNYGVVLWRAGRYRDAARHYQTSLRFLPPGETREKARLLTNLGGVLTRLGRYQDAIRHLWRAVTIYTEINHRSAEINDSFGEGVARDNLGTLYQQLNRYLDALDQFQQALVLYRRARNPSEQACAHSNLGLIASKLGRHREALAHHRSALTILDNINDLQRTAEVHNRLGATLLLFGRPRLALTHHNHALALATEIDDKHERTIALESINRCHNTLGDITSVPLSGQMPSNEE